jgi:hypothetical protein
VAIRLTPEGENFWVEVTPPHAKTWRSHAPLTATDVLEVLSRKGCRFPDVADALTAADPGWSARHEAEILRREQVSYDRPDEAARRRWESAEVLALEESPEGRYAVALVDTERPGGRDLREVICERHDDGWHSCLDNNAMGWNALPWPPNHDGEGEYSGVVTFWGEAPPGARSVTIRWRDRLHEVPVRNGCYLFASWHVPSPDTLPRLA